jgi:hypothetical protein
MSTAAMSASADDRPLGFLDRPRLGGVSAVAELNSAI